MPEVSPFNTLILLILTGYILVKSKHWMGPSQDARIKRLEEFEKRTLTRLERIEENYLGMGREIDLSIGNLAGEVRQVRNEMHELRRAVDRFGVRGCGYEGCPRVGESK